MTPAPSPSDQLLSLQQCQAELAQLRASHEALLRAIAHDLRAPLRHVMSFAPLLRESVQELAQAASDSHSEAAQDAQEFAATMEQSARRMARMLDGLTEISRAVRAPLQLQAVCWRQVCEDVCAQVQAQHPQLQVHMEMPEQVWLQADAQALRHVTQALIDNAAKFSARAAAPQLRLMAQLSADSAHWQLVLQDNGVGFDSARAQQLFGLFQRMHRESEFDGVGCGLALVHAVAQRHRADVQLQAQPQQGCTVVLRWPAAV